MPFLRDNASVRFRMVLRSFFIIAVISGGYAKILGAETGPSKVPEQVPAPRVAEAKPVGAPLETPKSAANPKEALKLLNSAMREGDPRQIRSLMYATTPEEVRMISAMAEVAQAMVELNKAALDAFGAEGAREVTGDSEAESAQGLARIESAEVKVDGEFATVTYIDKKKDETGHEVEERSEFQLHKTTGGWKVPVSQLAKGATTETLERRLNELDTQTAIVRDVTKEIASNKFNSAEQAAEAWHSKLMQSLTPRPVAGKK
jgi:hypothetical protein